ncbi:hypothetical protein ABK040_013598 [Willaertia magna]
MLLVSSPISLFNLFNNNNNYNMVETSKEYKGEEHKVEDIRREGKKGVLISSLSTFQTKKNIKKHYLCKDIVVIICSFLEADDLWSTARYININFHEASLDNTLWKGLYQMKWKENIHIKEQDQNTEWWRTYMERRVWLSFRLNKKEIRRAKESNVYNLFFEDSVKGWSKEEVYQNRTVTLKKLALKVDSNRNAKNRLSIENFLFYAQLFLNNYFVEGSNLNINNNVEFKFQYFEVLFGIIQSYSILGNFSKLVVYCSEFVDKYNELNLENNKLLDMNNESVFIRGYANYKIGNYKCALKDIDVEWNRLQSLEITNKIEDVEGTDKKSRKLHEINVLYTLITTVVRLEQLDKGLQLFNHLLNLFYNYQQPRNEELTTIKNKEIYLLRNIKKLDCSLN